METIQYDGKNVYTSSNKNTQISDLVDSNKGQAVIQDAYFFRIGPGRVIEKTDFDKQAIEDNSSGLMVDVKSKKEGDTLLPIAGLDRITQFLYDTNSLGNLDNLKGMEVTEYNRGSQLLGIGIPQ